jgi:hypothetical protein
VIKSLPAIGNLGLLAFLFLFIYALVGKSFFHGEMFNLDGEPTRYNFNGMLNSLLVMFILLSGENWNEIMAIVWNAHGVLAILFFVSAMIIGNFMLLNLFLAILLKYIEENDDDDLDMESNELRALAEAVKQAEANLQENSQNKPASVPVVEDPASIRASDLNENEIQQVMKAGQPVSSPLNKPGKESVKQNPNEPFKEN